jgi:uncharacterized protein with PIN domain
MANVPGPQPQIRYCPICRGELRNVPPQEMRSRARSEHTHTYECTATECHVRFEINQDR